MSAPHCPACGRHGAEPVLRLDGVPLLPNAACRSAAEARSVARGDIDLVVCRRCGHLFNAAFDQRRLVYDARYENSLGFSPSFATYAAALADRLEAEGAVTGRTVVELGSGPGEFLALLAERGAKAALGFDPSFDPQRAARPSHPAVQVEPRLLPTDGSVTPDLLIARHVLEHLDEPVAVLSSIRPILSADAQAYLEVPNAASMVKRSTLWDLIYEHRSYFTEQSLLVLLTRCGLHPTSSWTDYDDQFLCATAAVTPSGPASEPLALTPTDSWLPSVRTFGSATQHLIADGKAMLAELGRHGPVALWGAGSKGIMFCNLVAPDDGVDVVIDLNPRKHGTFVAGTGHEVSAPSALSSLTPASVLVTNPLYRDEIQAQVAELAPGARVEVLWN